MKALISGISGQDGSYLAELLLSKGYEVHGIVRRSSIDAEDRLWRIKGVADRLHIHSGTIESYQSMFRIIESIQPDEFYHLGAQSFVADSFKDEFTTMRVNIDSTHNILSILADRVPGCRFYFAASSEMYGDVLETPQTEATPFNPRSVYGITKCAGFHLTKHYRDARGMHASSGILFNHESPRRGSDFVTKKISLAAAAISLKRQDILKLGNLDAVRDWGHSKDYVEAMWLMLQKDAPDDYLIATGITASVRDFCGMCFTRVGLNWEDCVTVDSSFFRPTDVNLLVGSADKAHRELGWRPSVNLQQLADEMVDAALVKLSGGGVL